MATKFKLVLMDFIYVNGILQNGSAKTNLALEVLALLPTHHLPIELTL
ncbi:MAG: hypothetical protein PHT26_13065 [Lentimicrobiaceae bacterium]|nr:hypothetical protein [Lentimicrobiaceae bacterium]